MSDLSLFLARSNHVLKKEISTYPAFWNAFERANRGTYLTLFLQHLKENKDNFVIFTGHSLGGAIANIAGALSERNGTANQTSIVTFGSPSVFDKKTAQRMNSFFSKLSNIRIVHKNDPIPDSIERQPWDLIIGRLPLSPSVHVGGVAIITQDIGCPILAHSINDGYMNILTNQNCDLWYKKLKKDIKKEYVLTCLEKLLKDGITVEEAYTKIAIGMKINVAKLVRKYLTV